MKFKQIGALIQNFIQDDVFYELLAMGILIGIILIRYALGPNLPMSDGPLILIGLMGMIIALMIVWKGLHRIIEVFPKTRIPIVLTIMINGFMPAIWQIIHSKNPVFWTLFIVCGIIFIAWAFFGKSSNYEARCER